MEQHMLGGAFFGARLADKWGKREGDVKQLIKYESVCNYKIIKPKPSLIKKKIISSSLIRNYLQSGKLDKANNLLNRKWSIIGKVQKGRQLGKESNHEKHFLS